MMMSKALPAVLAALMLVGACTTDIGHKTQAAVDSVPTEVVPVSLSGPGLRGDSNDVSGRAAAMKNMAVVRAASAPWIGGSFVPTTKEDVLPAIFQEAYAFDFGEGRVSLGAVAARLTKMTGVPVRIRGDVYSTRAAGMVTPGITGGSAMPTPLPSPGASVQSAPLPSSGVPAAGFLPSSAVSSQDAVSVDAIGMRWNGRLRDFLDHLTNSLSLAWEYRDGAVVIMRLVTQSHALAVLPGAQKYAVTTGATAGGSNQGTGTGSAQLTKGEFSDVGQMDAFQAISDAVKSMIAPVPGSTLVLNAQTGTLVVTTSKEVQAQVRDYLDAENAAMRQLVNVTLDVYTIKTSDTDAQAIEWNAVYKTLSGSLDMGVGASLTTSTVGGATLTKLTGSTAGSSLVLKALRSTGKAVSHRPISLTTLNGKLRTQTSTATTAYVKETTPGLSSVSGAAGAPGLKTDTLVTGDIFAVLPVIQPDNSVIVKYSLSLSSLTGLEKFTSGTGTAQQTIQIPTTDAVTDGADLRLKAGESFLITGLSRLTTGDDTARLGEGASILLGGANKKTVVREHFIVLVRATPI